MGLIKEEVYVMFKQFYQNAVSPKSLTFLSVALIPKVEPLMELGYFRLISLLGSL